MVYIIYKFLGLDGYEVYHRKTLITMNQLVSQSFNPFISDILVAEYAWVNNRVDRNNR